MNIFPHHDKGNTGVLIDRIYNGTGNRYKNIHTCSVLTMTPTNYSTMHLVQCDAKLAQVFVCRRTTSIADINNYYPS